MNQSLQAFEEHRSHLEGVAYRMLGSVSEAQDIVQDTYLRWSRVDQQSVRSPRAWLVTTCSRIAIDVLKSARVKREEYHGPWLPEPLLIDDKPQPDEQAEVDDTVSVALLLALEKLSPTERAVFLLHDVFAYPLDEVGDILGKKGTACRQLALRARKHMQEAKPRFQSTPDEHRRLLDAFMKAARDGDVHGLKALLRNSVTLHSDGGGKAAAAARVLTSPDVVALFFCKVLVCKNEKTDHFYTVPCWFNGAPGLVVLEKNLPVTAFSLCVEEGQIEAIYAHRNPDKLRIFGQCLQ